ncbi:MULTISPECIES: CpaF family protein [Halorhodospira]|uniref:CpaF family protein n=1 Tax=Halorhodospira TaxID=85108 RepID=UPI001913E720|nr:MULTISPECIES: CpaF family protein [Halorhodospira]MBK5937151.1 pilus assembly protein CpaF [Halorhodospira halophila]MCG5538638.1 CpaF family protein [Halorhodospira sp. 9622]MCG5540419.1 CpaF family protein [Halorhodospira sp. M39old]MCG5545728.1 CpaF family protein [Halorhodospira sp. M38]
MAELARNWAEDHASAVRALKGRIHNHLLEQLNLEVIDRLEPEVVRQQIAALVAERLREERVPLNAAERDRLIEEMQYEMLGLGPLEPLLADTSISEILVNTCRQTYVERRGVLERSPVSFGSDAHLMRIIDKIASAVGRRIDESSPMVDARLADGSRVNAIIPPLAVDGPILSIRKFSADPYSMQDLTAFRSLTPGMASFLEGAIRARVNLLVSGGTGSGKTTLLNALSGYIPASERIISIEDSAELQLQQPHVVRLETRPPNIEGRGEITQRDLVRNALRMRPDRIIVGEVRGGEAMDMLQAMNTGHDGSLSTIHANSARDALTRLEHMVGMSGVSIPQPVARHQIASALQLLVNIERLIDGRRVVTSIQEITGMEEHVVTTQELFTFTRQGLDGHGGVTGHFRATGIRPWLLQRFRERGVAIDESIFDPERVYA